MQNKKLEELTDRELMAVKQQQEEILRNAQHSLSAINFEVQKRVHEYNEEFKKVAAS